MIVVLTEAAEINSAMLRPLASTISMKLILGSSKDVNRRPERQTAPNVAEQRSSCLRFIKVPPENASVLSPTLCSVSYICKLGNVWAPRAIEQIARRTGAAMIDRVLHSSLDASWLASRKEQPNDKMLVRFGSNTKGQETGLQLRIAPITQ